MYEELELTYAELNGKANQLARYLREAGVGPDRRVGICVERGLNMMIGLLGILKAGGAYVPLDPGYPAERLAFMLADSSPVVLLEEAATQGRVTGAGSEIRRVNLDSERSLWSGRGEANLDDVGLGPQHLAYVIYTSGSTGQPKGVMVEQGGVVNVAYALSLIHI